MNIYLFRGDPNNHDAYTVKLGIDYPDAVSDYISVFQGFAFKNKSWSGQQYLLFHPIQLKIRSWWAGKEEMIELSQVRI